MQHPYNRVVTVSTSEFNYDTLLSLVELGARVQPAVEAEHYFPQHEVSMRLGKALLERMKEA